MSNINIKNFVDINIIPHLTSQNVGIRDTIVLFTSETNPLGIVTLNSLSEATEYCGNSMTSTLAYLKVYFDNGGVKAMVIPGKSSDSLLADVKGLENKYICISFAGGTETDTYDNLLDLATDLNEDPTIYGVNQKLILARRSAIVDPETKNFIVKYSSVLGAEMTIAAYLSRINVYRADTVYDYMFTVESIDPEDIDDSVYKSIIQKNLNVDITLANATRNCGGNCTDGDDIVNNFTRIVLQQTVTEVVLNTLTQKLKNQSGLNKIYSTIANELENYKRCGYLTTDKIWDDEDLYMEYPANSGSNYLIIEKGTAIQNGYFIKILPFNSLSDDDKRDRNTPPIYIIIAEQYGIRKITINGEAI